MRPKVRKTATEKMRIKKLNALSNTMDKNESLEVQDVGLEVENYITGLGLRDERGLTPLTTRNDVLTSFDDTISDIQCEIDELQDKVNVLEECQEEFENLTRNND